MVQPTDSAAVNCVMFDCLNACKIVNLSVVFTDLYTRIACLINLLLSQELSVERSVASGSFNLRPQLFVLLVGPLLIGYALFGTESTKIKVVNELP